MDTKINNETISLFFDKLAKLFNYFFPGIVILELFFNKGFFSNPPENIYSFFLYIIWGGILSLPFDFIQPLSIEKFNDRINDIICKKTKTAKKDLKKGIGDYEGWEDSEEEFRLGFILIKLFLTYIVFKLLIFIGFPSVECIKIPINILQLLITLLIVFFISYPIGYVYSKIFLSLISKMIDD